MRGLDLLSVYIRPGPAETEGASTTDDSRTYVVTAEEWSRRECILQQHGLNTNVLHDIDTQRNKLIELLNSAHTTSWKDNIRDKNFYDFHESEFYSKLCGTRNYLGDSIFYIRQEANYRLPENLFNQEYNLIAAVNEHVEQSEWKSKIAARGNNEGCSDVNY